MTIYPPPDSLFLRDPELYIAADPTVLTADQIAMAVSVAPAALLKHAVDRLTPSQLAAAAMNAPRTALRLASWRLPRSTFRKLAARYPRLSFAHNPIRTVLAQ